MGYAKYNEDDDDIMQGRRYMRQPNVFGTVKPKVTYYDCPYCSGIFDDRIKLYEHIRKAHGILHPIFTLNGKVPTWDKTFYIDRVQDAAIHLYGFPQKVEVNGKNLEITDDLDISNEIRTALGEKGKCNLKVGDHSIQICAYTVADIRKEIVRPVIEAWNKQAENSEPIKKYDPSGCTSAEKKYLDGFYNYFLACDKSCKDKNKRYNDAWAMLSSFMTVDALSACALKAIAFRRNWTEQLSALCEVDDDFMLANHLFQKYDFDMSGTADLNGGELYIEDTLRQDLDAIKNMFSKDWKAIHERFADIKDIEEFEDISDVNHRNRLLLVYAIYQVHKGKNGLANECAERMTVSVFKNIIREMLGKNI